MKTILLRHRTAKRLAAMLIVGLLSAAVLMSACADTSQKPAPSVPSGTETPDQTLTVEQASASNKHSSRGATCQSCHEDAQGGTYQTPDADACYSCHSAATIIKATAGYEDTTLPMQNPHDSHVGTPRCSSCHSNHGDSKLYCNECHMPDFEIDVP